jgi:hypothetical protein
MPRKSTFKLTPADIELLDLLVDSIPSVLLYPASEVKRVGNENQRIVWTVLGEKHGFVPLTAEAHPTKEEPYILAQKVK